MKKCQLTLAVLFLSLTLVACAPSGSSTSELSPREILEILETTANEQDLEGTMALFAEDAVLEESFKNFTIEGTEELERFWKGYYSTEPTGEFRDISVDGDTSTFNWAEIFKTHSKLWPAIIEVQNGKITYLDFYEDGTTVFAGEE